MPKTNVPKVIFTKPFDYFPSRTPRVCTTYEPSDKPQPVTEECAERAIRLGYATEAPTETKATRKRSMAPAVKKAE